MESRFKVKKNAANAVIAFTINVALVFLTYRLVIQKGGIGALGLWSTLNAWIYVLRIGDVGMAGAATKFIATNDLKDGGQQIRSYCDTSIIFNSLLFGAIAAISTVVFGQFLSSMVPQDSMEESRALLPLLFLGFFLSNLSTLLFGVLQGLHYGYAASRTSIVGSLIQLLVVYLYVPTKGLPGLAWAIVLQQLFTIVAAWVFICRLTPSCAMIPNKWSTAVFKEMISFSLKIQFINLLNSVFEPLSKILISRFSGLDAQGLYELAFKTVSLPRNAVMSATQATLPATAGLLISDPEGVKLLYRRGNQITTKALGFLLSSIAVGAPFIALLWLGQFDSTYWFFTICLAAGFFGNSLGASAYVLGIASGKIQGNLLSSAATLIVLVVLGFALGSIYGHHGIAVASGLALFAGGLIVKRANEKRILAKI